ncbi:hypothetical protein Q1695_010433 [Nippostrongylus brasiliensis]|nr:hypothetical protein Q1695_010433 [Nippostrongylus brasiliensis]
MWLGHLVAIAVALLAHEVSAADDFIAKKVFLKTPASFVNLTSEAWKVHDRNVEIMLVVRFQPNSKVGQVFSLRAIDQTGRKIIKLVGSLHSGYLQIDLFNAEAQSILNKPFSTHFLEQNEEHSLAVTINTTTKTLSYRLASTTDHWCEIADDIDLLEAELVPTLGGGGNSMIGCVTLVTVEVGGVTPPYDVMAIASNEIDECSDGNECSQRDCNKGRCLPLEVAVCDCYGTEKSGPNCRYPARTVFVENNDDESQPSNIRYTPWKVDQIISRITIEFRFAELDNKQGVLLHSLLDDGSVLKLFVVEGNGNLLFGSLGSINFTLDATKDFHSVFISIHHESHSIALVVDEQTQTFTVPDSDVDLRLTSLLFGGAPATNGARELGITACLKNIYVDHHDIIYMMYDNDKRVESSKPLGPCNRDGSLPDLFAVGLPLFAPDPLPGDLSDVSSVHGITDTDDAAVNVSESGEKVEVNKAGGGLFSVIHQKLPSAPTPCEKSQDYVCRNGASCERHADEVVCVCRRGFGGRYCQFVLHPQTCAEARLFRRQLPSGPTQLDVDGSGPLYGSVAMCQDGMTVVPHDMPPATVIRSSDDRTDALFIISYRDFTSEKLSRLIRNSASCKQELRYDCNNAALGFGSNRTWFGVAVGNRTVAQLGRIPNSCPCFDVGCIANEKCNCDSRAISSDAGFLYDDNAGVIRVVARHSEGDISGKLTIGPVECEGFAASGPVRFAEPRALAVGNWLGQQLSLQFRTGLSSATLVSVRENHEKFLIVELLYGHIVRISTKNMTASLESQARLNDTKWHLLTLEVANDEIRIGVDDLNTFASINQTYIPKGVVQLNHDESGFTGCIRSVQLDDEAVDVQRVGRGVPDVYLHCDDQCHQNLCQNSAECIEDFTADAAICRCRNPNVQSGRNCEIDINKNSSVSFHGGFIKYELPHNPLLDQTVLSFRTDQSQALIMFVHDHNNNFMQLHLSEEVNLTLSLNNDDVVSSCTIRARAGTEFGNMEWIQITIEHSDDSSTLTVNDDACLIRTPRKLAKTPIQKFINVFTDIVIIPVGLNSPVNPKPFHYTFIGGVEKESHSTDGSMLLRPIYQCAVQNLLGCVRGLRVGGKLVDMLLESRELGGSDLVHSGCDMGCGSLDCKNGGHCSVAWQSDEKVVCDCSRTSYAGPDCTVDEGIILASNAYLTFDNRGFLSRYILPPQKRTQTLQFAFAPSVPSTSHQFLANVLFNDGRVFEVILNKNGSVNVAVVDDSRRTVVRTFAGNFHNGYRHFFVARFGAHQATTVIIDTTRHDFDFVADNLDLFQAKEINLGGREVELLAASDKSNYSGCISNLDIDYGVPALHVTPIADLDNQSMISYSRLSPAVVVVQRGACAPFQIQNSLRVFINPVELPVWETNFKRLVYHDNNSDSLSEEGQFWMWGLCIVISLMVMLLLMTLIVCCCCLIGGGKSSAKPRISKDEEQPLHTANSTPLPNLLERQPKFGAQKHVTIADPFNEKKLEPFPEDDGELKQESLSDDAAGDEDDLDDDLDETLRDIGDENYDMQDVTRTTSFDRSSPRSSPFRQGDPTVPKDSPLYAAPTSPSLRPIPVPVPPSQRLSS